MLPPTTTAGRLLLLGTLFLSGTTALAQQQAPDHQEMRHNPLGRLFHGIAASPKPNKAARPIAPADPVQSSYDTSTGVDPSTWSHIADPTYGGLRGPPLPQQQQQQPQLQASAVSGSGGRQEFVIVNHDPVQTSYDTSTAADPTDWRRISDPTYGGMTAPGPAETQMVAKRADSSSTSSSSSSKSGKDNKSTTTETTSRSGTTETATRTDTRSASGSSSASSASSSGAAAPGVIVPWVFAVLLRYL
ncbi:uncharacterized protein LTHEOB_2950 [Lasiodiplodia theobromae]|uniref:uncharacterized protein n=1 Tax=Lasiodiplodia theobromae TaxID=45133 RepID=UPI0015C32BB9|nr:uncharacterized protein LTHEOB_2950 [Lasiodiplodia theobromae]KAF4534975.1 hypothetical protein LTHEOB_2950 [Lasiodiplodia theobromae]